MKTILVPTDFSDHAFYALKVAASIARKVEADIELVHVYYLPKSGFELYHLYDEFYKEIHKNATAQLDKLLGEEFLQGISVNKHIITDMLLWRIFDTVKFKDVDLIVIGAHGSGGLDSPFIGSNTEKVVRMADTPVLTIKKEIDECSFKKVVFASDFQKESYASFNKIKFFADIFEAHLDLLKVITPRDFEPTPISLQLMETFAEKFNLTRYTTNIYNDRNIEMGITDFCNEVQADLLAIETHGRTGIAHLINGSLAEDVVKHENRPVLSIKIKDIPLNISGLRPLMDHMQKVSPDSGLASMLY